MSVHEADSEVEGSLLACADSRAALLPVDDRYGSRGPPPPSRYGPGPDLYRGGGGGGGGYDRYAPPPSRYDDRPRSRYDDHDRRDR